MSFFNTNNHQQNIQQSLLTHNFLFGRLFSLSFFVYLTTNDNFIFTQFSLTSIYRLCLLARQSFSPISLLHLFITSVFSLVNRFPPFLFVICLSPLSFRTSIFFSYANHSLHLSPQQSLFPPRIIFLFTRPVNLLQPPKHISLNCIFSCCPRLLSFSFCM